MIKYDFPNVYSDCKNGVGRLVSKYVASQEDREDLFQEIFMNVHAALPRFRGEAEVKTWVYRIAVNTAMNYLNKQKRYRWAKKVLNGFKLLDQEAPEIATDARLLKPLEKLNPQQKTILILADVEERKLDEISEMVKIPVGTVKSNLHRAREIVKKEVMENGGL